MHSGYYDRNEEKYAVIIIETIKKEIHIPVEELPVGSAPGLWFDVELDNDEIKHIQLNTTKSKAEFDQTAKLLAKLQAKGNKGNRLKKRK
ncbi:DUF3006 family protein [Cytobacillus purgationiresistens]|uniref:DUF3006 domain-containing protein n=1 Tax=Cytobacillus purgationiresistens TaxID=863449 RepID=A0ABU0AAM4_9BACI|nr:DUF3006 family protein [Cytobacillus purgationiresistens]MDQ0268300.1 hypothetical protein [Cytobacillus purgationiresistens]